MNGSPGAAHQGGRLDPARRGELRDRIDDYFEDVALPELAAYGAIPCLSPSFDPGWEASGHLDRAAEQVRAFAAGRRLEGATSEVVRLPGRTPVVLVEVPATDPARAGSTTLVYGHLDKQPPLGEWRAGLAPYRPVREGDLLYGRGLADDGYAAFSVLGALGALQAMQVGHGRVVVLVEASEESASPDLDAYLDHLAPRLGEVGLVVCLDSGGPSYDRLWVTSSLRGTLVVTLTAEVLTQAVHSGLAAGVVPSSFRVLRQLLARIEDEATGAILVPELLQATPEHRRREIEAVAAELGEAAVGSLPAVEGLRLLGGSAAERLEALTWRPALSVIGAGGLPALAEGGNVLRPSSSLKVSIRLPPTCDAPAALAALERVVLDDPPEGARVGFTAEAPAQGWDAPPLSPSLEGILEDASRAHYGGSFRSLGLGGSIPFLAAFGRRWPAAQLLATGVLGPGSNAHGPNEALHLPAAKALTACLAEVLAAEAGPGAAESGAGADDSASASGDAG